MHQKHLLSPTPLSLTVTNFFSLLQARQNAALLSGSPVPHAGHPQLLTKMQNFFFFSAQKSISAGIQDPTNLSDVPLNSGFKFGLPKMVGLFSTTLP